MQAKNRLWSSKKEKEDMKKSTIESHNGDCPRFIDQVGHQTTNAFIGNKHFFTK